jgi:hypothetical protein
VPVFERRGTLKRLGILAIVLVAVAAAMPAAAAGARVETTVELEIYGEIASSGEVHYYFTGIARPEGFPNFGGLFEEGDDFEILQPIKPRRKRKRGPGKYCGFTIRAVELFRDEPEGPDTLVGHGETSVSIMFGEFTIPANQVPGSSYYAQVAGKILKAKGKRPKVNCLPAASPPVAVHPPNFG